MSTDKEQGSATRGSLRLAPSCAELEELKAKLPRQFVNFLDRRPAYECRFHDLAYWIRTRSHPGDDRKTEPYGNGEIHRTIAVVSFDDQAFNVYR